MRVWTFGHLAPMPSCAWRPMGESGSKQANSKKTPRPGALWHEPPSDLGVSSDPLAKLEQISLPASTSVTRHSCSPPPAEELESTACPGGVPRRRGQGIRGL